MRADALLAIARPHWRLSADVRARLYRQLAALLAGGVPLPVALDLMGRYRARGSQRWRSRRTIAAIDRWRRNVLEGRDIGAALRTDVPNHDGLILDAGASDLPQALEDVARLIDIQQKMRAALTSASLYPAFLLLLLGGLFWLFNSQVIPAFAAIRPVSSWTGAPRILAATAQVLAVLGGPSAVLLLLIGAALVWSLPRWTGPGRLRCDGMPPWSFYRFLTGIEFMLALAALLRAGVPLPEGLRRLHPAADPWLRERLDAILYYIVSGHDLGESLALAGGDFPSPVLIEELRVYMALPGSDRNLRQLADRWAQDSLHSVERLADLGKLVAMAAIASAIAWIQWGLIAMQRQLTSGG